MESSQNRTRFKGITRTAVNINMSGTAGTYMLTILGSLSIVRLMYVNTKDATNSVCNVTVYHTWVSIDMFYLGLQNLQTAHYTTTNI